MERKDELTLRAKTEYRQDYAPEVLESFVNKHPETTIGYVLTVPNLPACVLLQDSPILRKSVSPTCLM